MGKIVVLEDYGVEFREPPKIAKLQRALDILIEVETTGCALGDAQLMDAMLAIHNTICVMELKR